MAKCLVCGSELEAVNANVDFMVDHGADFQAIQITKQEGCPRCRITSIEFESVTNEDETVQEKWDIINALFYDGKRPMKWEGDEGTPTAQN